MSDCCCGSSGCCSQSQPKKMITIDFLYLDLSICERCQGAENNLDQAINEVSAVLSAAEYEVIVNKVNISSKELAIKYEFVSSPTIRINGNDIALEVKESTCQDCGDLCGDTVDCRVWTHNGVEYTKPPKALIINAILSEIYNGKHISNHKKYELPENLNSFFEAMKSK